MEEIEPSPHVSKHLAEILKHKSCLENQKQQLETIRNVYKDLVASNRLMMKQILRLEKKFSKSSHSVRKTYGFARPTNVSDEVCVFLGKELGSKVSRTEVTKAIVKYISDKKLQNPENKRQIIPDDTLMKLFGDAAKDIKIDYFTMQKYLNHHFVKASEVVSVVL